MQKKATVTGLARKWIREFISAATSSPRATVTTIETRYQDPLNDLAVFMVGFARRHHGFRASVASSKIGQFTRHRLVFNARILVPRLLPPALPGMMRQIVRECSVARDESDGSKRIATTRSSGSPSRVTSMPVSVRRTMPSRSRSFNDASSAA
jgi:hypothetical protein